jgi:hypothetical protein
MSRYEMEMAYRATREGLSFVVPGKPKCQHQPSLAGCGTVTARQASEAAAPKARPRRAVMRNWQRRREVRPGKSHHFVFDGMAGKGEKKIKHET